MVDGKIPVAINGYGVIGKRGADAIAERDADASIAKTNAALGVRTELI
jgi:glyceraldehyde-3-phosphate dehydrogenase/erythrose-4-phosphate dehydrogenase